MTNTQRWNYIRQIKRLQAENRVLRSVIVEERMRRQRAYSWYIRKINSRFLWIVDVMLFSFTHYVRNR